MDTTNDNKNVQVLKNKIWTRQVTTEAEVVVFRRNQIVKKTILLNEIWRNQAKKQEIYVLNNRKIQE